MKFVYELSLKTDLTVPQKATKYYEVSAGAFGRRLRPIKKFDVRTVESLRREKITDLELFSWDIDKNIDLNILKLAPELKSFSILSEKPIDWTPLRHLRGIERLRLITRGYTPQSLDFTGFQKLHTLHMTWHQEWASALSSRTIRGLTIESSNGMQELDVSRMPNLSELCLTECARLRRVSCSPTQSLVSLGIASCRAFESVEPFGAMKTLKYIALGGKSRFEIESLRKCPGLKRLSLLGVGKIRSIKFLSRCRNLERLAMHFSTQVEDGDLKVLLNLPKLNQVSFRRFKNYTHSLEQVKRCHNITG